MTSSYGNKTRTSKHTHTQTHTQRERAGLLGQGGDRIQHKQQHLPADLALDIGKPAKSKR